MEEIINATSTIIKNITSDISGILNSIVSFFAGALVTIFAEPIRKRIFSPELALDYKKDSKDYVTRTNFQDGKFDIYVRAKVINKKKHLAKDCRAFLINIEKEDNGNFVQTVYADSLQLAWSCQIDQMRYSAICLSYGVNLYFDIFRTTSTDPPNAASFHPLANALPLRYNDENLFFLPGKYRLTIQVTSSNANPIKMCLILQWKCDCQDFIIDKEK